MLRIRSRIQQHTGILIQQHTGIRIQQHTGIRIQQHTGILIRQNAMDPVLMFITSAELYTKSILLNVE